MDFGIKQRWLYKPAGFWKKHLILFGNKFTFITDKRTTVPFSTKFLMPPKGVRQPYIVMAFNFEKKARKQLVTVEISSSNFRFYLPLIYLRIWASLLWKVRHINITLLLPCMLVYFIWALLIYQIVRSSYNLGQNSWNT